MTKLFIQPQPMTPLHKQQNNKISNNVREQSGKSDFSQVLQQAVESKQLKFSNHAQKRLDSRNITLNDGDIAKLEAALEKASKKGARESLVLIDKNAFVLSVPNKTVITAVDESSLRENVFTNIDSAIIM
ncbi:flagellar operon protein [Desulfitispora alkaliphila]|uniref:TIGR02530 family flagellar biosynthesis protein n=1 Tax=Desulfitispora alkaliphila TaxID=622674 RepID=UPI003D219FA4